MDIKKQIALDNIRQFWDAEATSFDNEPDHGLNDPVVLKAWTELLKKGLPQAPAKILDIGCGTGSLSVVLAGLGHSVTGIDLSPAMIVAAREKALKAGYQISFYEMEASYPELLEKPFDGILCRHLLWSLTDINKVLQHWMALLKPKGCLLLVEGFWHTGVGLHSEEILSAFPAPFTKIALWDISCEPDFWGRNVDDERYAIMAELSE